MASELQWDFRDGKGDVCKTSVWLAGVVTDPSGGVAGTLRTALQAISNLALFRAAIIPVDETDAGAAVAGDYEDIGDKVVLEFQDASGATHTYRFPCPKSTIFQADQVSVDPGDPAVAALITAFLNNVKGTGGANLTTFVRGWRARNNSRRTR